jgi:hypothetical protein
MNEASRFEKMTEDQFNDELEEKYPELWPKAHPVFLIGKGWWQLIEEFYEEMNRQYIESEDRSAWLDSFRVIDIKNKLGHLQIYYALTYAKKSSRGSSLDVIKKSQKICEECGKEGSLRPSLDYIQTLCGEHYQHIVKNGRSAR